MSVSQPASQKKIIHVDMDAFYPSIEQRDFPCLRGKPVVVGGSPKSRGVVASASYEARAFGIKSAMSSAQAYRLCPHAEFVHPRFDVYVDVSKKIRKIFKSYTPIIEPLALDEAYLDVTHNLVNQPLASRIAQDIKSRIKSELHLTASAGVGPNKFIAKLGSAMNKPDGLTIVPPEKVADLVKDLPVDKLWGVGPATAKRLHHAGFYSTRDLRSTSLETLQDLLGKSALFIYEMAHGRDDREVESEHLRKSRGTEQTFSKDQNDLETLKDVLKGQAEEIAEELIQRKERCKTVTLKVKYADFTTITRSRTLRLPFRGASEIYSISSELLENTTDAGWSPVRLIGVSVSNLIEPSDPIQLWFEFDRKS